MHSERFALLPLGFLVFGGMFVWLGVRRMLGSVREPKPGEAMFWGIVGVSIGVGLWAALWWMYGSAVTG